MQRIELFEFNDSPWVPRFLRESQTLFLEELHRWIKFPPLWTQKIQQAVIANRSNEILDLCSGSGGPLIPLSKKLEIDNLKVNLSDLYPSLEAIEKVQELDLNIRYLTRAIDAADVPSYLPGTRTVFCGLHHFSPLLAKALLRDAFENQCSICIFELTKRSVLALLSSIMIPLLVLLLTPLIRPFSIRRLVFTYMLPLLPIMTWWDGLVSNLRTYSTDQLIKLVQDLEKDSYRWEIGETKIFGFPYKVPYIIGKTAEANYGKKRTA